MIFWAIQRRFLSFLHCLLYRFVPDNLTQGYLSRSFLTLGGEQPDKLRILECMVVKLLYKLAKYKLLDWIKCDVVFLRSLQWNLGEYHKRPSSLLFAASLWHGSTFGVEAGS